MRVSKESQLADRMVGRETLVDSSPPALRRRHGVQLHGRAVDAGDATAGVTGWPGLCLPGLTWEPSRDDLDGDVDDPAGLASAAHRQVRGTADGASPPGPLRDLLNPPGPASRPRQA